MFIVSLEYIRPLAEIEAALPEHIAYLERHYRAGTFLLSGRKEPRTGGVIVMQADSREQVAQIIAEDPLTCVARGGGKVLELLDQRGVASFLMS